MKINHVFLVPLIILSLPPAALFQEQIPIVSILAVLGLAGMLTLKSTATSMTSWSLLGLIIWGKVAADLYNLPSLDTALLLFEFMLVILLMEASNATMSFEKSYRRLEAKNDEISAQSRLLLVEWVRSQLLSLGELIGTAFGLSLGLLVAGDLVSVSFGQIAVSGILVLVAVIALLIILTYGREPEEEGRRRNPVSALSQFIRVH
jgi:hypothetical protein